MPGFRDGRVREAAGPLALTRREREIAVLIAQGCSTQQIAEELALTSGTVSNRVSDMLTRLGVGSRAEIAAWAVEHGLGPRQDRRLTTLERLLPAHSDDQHDEDAYSSELNYELIHGASERVPRCSAGERDRQAGKGAAPARAAPCCSRRSYWPTPV
jgi:DNA-binding CsgD family transcriptional regulator